MNTKYLKWILVIFGMFLVIGILLIIIERSVIRSRIGRPQKSEIRSQFYK